MKRVLLALLFVVGLAFPAQADHAGSTVFFKTYQGQRWNESVSRTYCISPDFAELLGSGSSAGAHDSINNAVSRWETNTNLDSDVFSVRGADCNDFNYPARYNNSGGTYDSYCASIPLSEDSSFQLDSLNAPNVFAVTISCDRDNDPNNRIDYFTVAFNRDLLVGGNGTRWDWTQTPQSGEVDFLGLVMHEFGHALGSDGGFGDGGPGHFSESGSACPDTIDRGTMCAYWNAWKVYAGHPGTWARTLTVHDEGIVNEIYP